MSWRDLKKLFKRKQKLLKGLPTRKLDPDARWLVKQTDRHAAEQAKTANKVTRLESLKRTQVFLDLIAVTIVLMAMSVNVFYAYIFFAPISMIAQVSPEEARWVDVLRKSGCADDYARAAFLSPLVGPEGKFMLQGFYYDCAKARMDFPA